MNCRQCNADISGKRKGAKWCSRKCHSAAWRAADPVAAAAYQRQWRAANHLEADREYQRNWRAANRDAILARRRASRDAKAALELAQ